MKIPSEQFKTLTGATNTILLNPNYRYTQVTIKGRNVGTITGTARPYLETNVPANFIDSEFESVDGAVVNLATLPGKRTFTIEKKLATALKLVDDNFAAGSYQVFIKQWGRAV